MVRIPLPGVVDVWVVPVRATGPLGWVAGREALSAEQRARADRLQVADRHRFTVSRLALRRLAEAYLPEPAGAALIEHAPGRPPRLVSPPLPLHMSLSHSGQLVVCAFACRPVGVDVEGVEDDQQHGVELADSVLTAAERDHWRALDPDRREAAFRRLWVRKEAVAKATGLGLALDLATTDVSRSWTTASGHRHWLRAVRVPRGYVAAVASGGPMALVRTRTLATLR